MELIKPSDPEYFEQNSYELYDRHKYKVVFRDGKTIIVDDYEHLRLLWFQGIRNWEGAVVEVIDTETNSKGFGCHK